MANHKTVYFVRHGQSEANVAPVFQGPDSPLSEEGRVQADKIAERVSKLSFEALISSSVLRAKQTAEAIGQATAKIPEYNELFIEGVKPSGARGKSYDDAEASALWRRWEHSLVTPGVRVEDGENYDDLIARADKALTWLLERPEQALVVVTHSLLLKTLVVRTMLGKTLTPDNFKTFDSRVLTENTGLTVLRYEKAFEEGPCWRVWIYNDHAHLG